jgi:hypothetical protein
MLLFYHAALRKVSALLLCELTYNNQYIKHKIIQMLSIYPSYGRVIITIFRYASPDFHLIHQKTSKLSQVTSPLRRLPQTYQKLN